MSKILYLSCLFLWWWNAPTSQPSSSAVYAAIGRVGSNCAGSGVCSLGGGSGQAPPPPGYKAQIGFDTQGNLYLEFLYADLPPSLLSGPFGTDSFTMEEDFQVPVNILQSIDAKDTLLTLRTGHYPIAKGNQSLRVTFR